LSVIIDGVNGTPLLNPFALSETVLPQGKSSRCSKNSERKRKMLYNLILERGMISFEEILREVKISSRELEGELSRLVDYGLIKEEKFLQEWHYTPRE